MRGERKQRRRHTASDCGVAARAVTTAAVVAAAPRSFAAPSAPSMSCSRLLLVPISSRRELDIASVSEAEGDRLPGRGHGAPARAEHARNKHSAHAGAHAPAAVDQSRNAVPHTFDHRQAAPSGRQSTGKIFPRQGAHLALDLRGKARSRAQ